MNDLINSIIEEKEEKTKILLKEYLKQINKIEYFSLIIALIKLSKTNNEIGYTTPINMLIKLTKTQEKKEDDTLLSIAKGYIESIKEEIKEKGIIMISPTDEKIIKTILTVVETEENITTLVIGENKQKRLILRHTSTTYVNKKETLNKALNYYNKGNFKKAIKSYKDILGIKKIKEGLLVLLMIKLGLAHMKIKQYNLSLSYLKIAINFIKGETKTYLLETIEELERKTNNYEINTKYFTLANEQEFLSKNNIKETIKELIRTGLTLEEITSLLELNEEEKLLTIILQAEVYYENEQYALGDKLLKFLERSINKTKKINQSIKQTRKNKKLYKHRKH